MKIIFTGAEYHLSTFLNFIKFPMIVIVGLLLIGTLVQLDNGVEFKETFFAKNFWWIIPMISIFTAYMFLIWI